MRRGFRNPGDRAGVSVERTMNKAVTTKEAARQYRERGLRPIPLDPMSKKPSMRDWPSFKLTDETEARCFGPKANVGLITGEALVDVDLDVPQAITLAPGWRLRISRRCRAIPNRR